MRTPADLRRAPARVDIVLPVLNEERVLAQGVRTLRRHLAGMEHVDARIIIADNGSVDATHGIARRLAATLPGVDVLRLADRGRGRALRRTWMDSDAGVVAYMDIDLSTDLGHYRRARRGPVGSRSRLRGQPPLGWFRGDAELASRAHLPGIQRSAPTRASYAGS